MFNREIAAAARLDLAEVRRSRWLVFYGALYLLLAVGFVWTDTSESTVLGFSGTSRVLLALWHALVVILPLLALMASGTVINRARDDGSLELLFSHPLSRHHYFTGVTLVRYLSLLVPLLALLFGLAAVGVVGFGQAIPWAVMSRCAAISAALLWAFLGIGMAISTIVRQPAKALVVLLGVWSLAVALIDFALIGAMLEWHFDAATVFLLAALNPVEIARLALLANSSPTLATLGPVGLFLDTRLGSSTLVALGILWPTLVGSFFWLLGRGRFLHGDVV